MKIYFLRHAEADERPADAERELTPAGNRDAERLGRFLREIHVEFDLAFTSPLTRAVQTAEWIMKLCPPRNNGELAQTEALLIDTSEADFRKWIRGLPEVDSILLVGHEPALSSHVRRMIGVSTATALPLGKGALARVDSENRQDGTLRLLISPRQIP
jgi:phosphohistidine phosphatase